MPLSLDKLFGPHEPEGRQSIVYAKVLNDRRVLIVEDVATNRLVAKMLLEQMGLVVYEASDGREALAWLRVYTCDVVLMDLQMPVMDGLSATRCLRKELGLSLPVVALTANASSQARQACAQAGMDGFIAKPIQREVLASELCRVLSDV